MRSTARPRTIPVLCRGSPSADEPLPGAMTSPTTGVLVAPCAIRLKQAACEVRGREPPMSAGSDSRRSNGAALNRAQQLGNRQPKGASCAGGTDELARVGCQPADSVLGKPAVAPPRDLVGLEAPFPARPDHCVLAEAEYPRRSSGADQPGDAAHGGNGCSGHGVDVLETEAAVAPRGGFTRRPRAPCPRT